MNEISGASNCAILALPFTVVSSRRICTTSAAKSFTEAVHSSLAFALPSTELSAVTGISWPSALISSRGTKSATVNTPLNCGSSPVIFVPDMFPAMLIPNASSTTSGMLSVCASRSRAMSVASDTVILPAGIPSPSASSMSFAPEILTAFIDGAINTPPSSANVPVTAGWVAATWKFRSSSNRSPGSITPVVNARSLISYLESEERSSQTK